MTLRSTSAKSLSLRLTALALGITLGCGALPAQAGLFGNNASKKAPKKTAQPFLPPIATINGKIDHEFQADEAEPFEAITLSAVSAPTLRAGSRVEKLDTPMTLRPEDEFMALVKLRQDQDEADLDQLWEATVERNPIIRFSLEKIMSPDELRSKNSAMFSKVVSTLIQGAAMGSQMFMPGAGGYQNMGVMAVGQAANNLVTGQNKPQGPQLSPTEKIQLASLIDELKSRLIQTYGNYKNTLQLIAEARQNSVKSNNLYSQALATNNELAIMAAASAYYKSQQHETELRQQARLQQIQLERLAGIEAVQKLALAVEVPEALRKDLPTATASSSHFDPISSSLPSQPGPKGIPDSAVQAPEPLTIPTAPAAAASKSMPERTPDTPETVALPAVAEPQPEPPQAQPEFVGPTLDLAPDILPFSSQLAPSTDQLL